MVTVSQQPPTVMFTRMTSDRWKYLTERYASTTTPRPRTSRIPESVSSEKPAKGRYALVTAKSGGSKAGYESGNLLIKYIFLTYKL
jgi:hypothetical protein